MGKRRSWWKVGGVLFAAVFGTLLHFAYEWSGNSLWAAAFSAVNESTWEHMKLLFFPALAYTVLQLCAQKVLPQNFLAVRTAAILAAIWLIPVLFYTYSGMLGRQITWVNLLIFYLSAAVLFELDRRWSGQGKLSRPWQQAAGLAVLLGMALLFVFFTFAPPAAGLWQDPVTGGYGIV